MADRKIPCRKCGAMLQLTPNSVNSGVAVPSQNAVDAAYPADSNTTDQAASFAL